MSRQEVDDYLRTLDEPDKTTLGRLRDTIVEIVPDAQQCISYGFPAFKLQGKTIAGFGGFKNHLSYLPHSGSVLPLLADETDGYAQTKSSLHFRSDTPLPRKLVEQLLDARIAEALGSRS